MSKIKFGGNATIAGMNEALGHAAKQSKLLVEGAEISDAVIANMLENLTQHKGGTPTQIMDYICETCKNNVPKIIMGDCLSCITSQMTPDQKILCQHEWWSDLSSEEIHALLISHCDWYPNWEKLESFTKAVAAAIPYPPDADDKKNYKPPHQPNTTTQINHGDENYVKVDLSNGQPET